jgi:RHS repeat-associated protein
VQVQSHANDKSSTTPPRRWRPYGWEGASQRPTDRTPNLTSLIQMGARPYAPQIGRFLAVDPVEGGATTNAYGYVNDPYNSEDLNGRGISWTDPWGDTVGSVCSSCVTPVGRSSFQAADRAIDAVGPAVVGNRHTLINVGLGAGAATLAAVCVASVVCGVGMAAAGGAALVAAGTAAHVGSDRLANDRGRNYSVRRAARESFVSVAIGGACGAAAGSGCAGVALSRKSGASFMVRASFAAGAAATGWMLKYRGPR